MIEFFKTYNITLKSIIWITFSPLNLSVFLDADAGMQRYDNYYDYCDDINIMIYDHPYLTIIIVKLIYHTFQTDWLV